MNTYHNCPIRYQSPVCFRPAMVLSRTQTLVSPGAYFLLQLFGAAFSIGSFLGQQATDQTLFFSDGGFMILIISAVSIVLGVSSAHTAQITVVIRMIQALASAVALASILGSLVSSRTDSKVQQFISSYSFARTLSAILITGILCGYIAPYVGPCFGNLISITWSIPGSILRTCSSLQERSFSGKEVKQSAQTAEDYLFADGYK